MRKFLIALVVIPILLVLVCYGCIRVSNPNAGYENIRISKETTYLTEPLDEFGKVDYLEALNQQLSNGVTPENNAAVLFWQALGPAEIQPELRQEFFQRLGIEELPEDGEYFISPEDFVTGNPELMEQLKKKLGKEIKQAGPLSDEEFRELLRDAVVIPDEEAPTTVEELLRNQQDIATERPWSTEEFPVIAEWLRTNQEPMSLIEQGVLRDGYYTPLITDRWPPFYGMLGIGSFEGLDTALLRLEEQCRGVTNAFVVRAMWKLEQGDARGAWDDLQTCRKLGRKIATPPFLNCLFFGTNCEMAALAPTLLLLQVDNLAVSDLKVMRKESNELPPFPSVISYVNTGERIIFLDTTIAVSQKGMDQVFTNFDVQSDPLVQAGFDHFVDWNAVLSYANKHFDRAVEDLANPSHAARTYLESDKRQALFEASTRRDTLHSTHDKEAALERLSANLLLLMGPQKASELETHKECLRRLFDLAFALELYRNEHQAYPTKLDALVPRQLEAVPKDPYSETEFIFRREAGGYLLYSVGENLEDDGGESWYEDIDLDGDDIVIRITREAKDTEKKP